MPKRIELDGRRFGKWTVLDYAGDRRWNCRCDCGKKVSVLARSLMHGESHQCRSCAARERNHKHGASRTRIYGVWLTMKQRCHEPSSQSYHLYGARGIKVCDRWREDFGAFLRDMGPRPIGTSIDRIDNDGDYTPENCRWATEEQQKTNTRTNRWLEFGGERMILRDWAERIGITQQALIARLHKHPIEKALTMPPDERMIELRKGRT